MLHWLLPYINMNQSEGYTCPLSLEAPSPSHASEVFFFPLHLEKTPYSE